MSSGGSGGGSTTTVQKADPWIGVQPALSSLYSGASDWFNQRAANPTAGLADSNWNINHAIDLGAQTAQQGSPATTSARDLNLATTRGDFLNSNPHLDAMYKSATDPMVEQFRNATAPALASQFSMAGRMGSGAHDTAMGTAESALGRGLGAASASIYGGNYANERQLQQQASALSPALESAMYDPANKFLQIGQLQQQQAQDRLNAPLTTMQQLQGLLQGSGAYAGSSSSGNQSLNRNPFASAVGGAAAGSMLGSQIGMIGGPVGMGIGALLGGLFG